MIAPHGQFNFKDKSNIMTHGYHNKKNNIYYGKSYGDRFYNSSSTHAEMDAIKKLMVTGDVHLQ